MCLHKNKKIHLRYSNNSQIMKKQIVIFLVLCLCFMACGQKKVYLTHSAYTWHEKGIIQEPFKAIAISSDSIVSTYKSSMHTNEKKTRSWSTQNDISKYPQYQAPSVLEEAIYRMGLDEMVNAIEKDSTLRTGKEWAGVWTRDVSYSILLSMAYMQPKVAMNSLLRKITPHQRIVQDTGTGGAWPCSTDRIIWAVAAWEIYKVTGNKGWLNTVYPVICNSLEDDIKTAYDASTGLMRGESSFIDWREQSYPRWMQPADIYHSQCLGTNVVFARAFQIAARMASVLGKSKANTRYQVWSEKLKKAIHQQLWMSEKGYYAQYLYGRGALSRSERSETLGAALSIWMDVAPEECREQLVSSLPITPYGAPVFYPEIPNIAPYHNNAVWPFVASYWMLASAKAGNEASVMQSLGSIYRAAALFCTNKENFVAETGDYKGTEINSSNMLWSLSGNLSAVFRLLYGMHYKTDALCFSPFVPRVMKGQRKLHSFNYRNALLDITLEGCGDSIASFTLDGLAHAPRISADLKGRHRVHLVIMPSERMKNTTATVNEQTVKFTLEVPQVQLKKQQLSWQPIEHCEKYAIYRNGEKYAETKNTTYSLTQSGEYQVQSLDRNDLNSFLSEPLRFVSSDVRVYSFAPVRLTLKSPQTKIKRIIEVPREGTYVLDWRYANGNGPINTENKCGIRSLYVDAAYQGVSIFPQRGVNAWNKWGWSSATHLFLTQGKHEVVLRYQSWNQNMNEEINEAYVDALRMMLID
jgi:hypothetical protein